MTIRDFGARAASPQGEVPPLGSRHSSTSLSALDDTNSLIPGALRRLTPRQRDVLRVLMQGKSNKAIGRILNLAEPTVKNHVAAIFKALEVTNRTEAATKLSRGSAPGTSYTGPLDTYLGYVPPSLSLTFR